MSRVTFIAIAVLAIAAIAFAQNRNLCTAAARKEQCPPSAPFFGFMGCAAALVFACELPCSWLRPVSRLALRQFFFAYSGLGAAYGTAKSGVGVANMGVLHPDVVMKSIIPVVMAGVLGIYGLIVAVLLASGSESPALNCLLYCTCTRSTVVSTRLSLCESFHSVCQLYRDCFGACSLDSA